MKDTIDRFLGYLHTLLTEFNESKAKDGEKFANMFKDELSILSAISKILIDKLKGLMSLKNINGIGFVEFKQWISVLEYWRKYTDSLIEDNPLMNTEMDNDEVEEAINEAFKKMVTTFNINSTINELVLNYVSSYHQVPETLYRMSLKRNWSLRLQRKPGSRWKFQASLCRCLTTSPSGTSSTSAPTSQYPYLTIQNR